MSLAGKIVLVTGGAKGIGRAVVVADIDGDAASATAAALAADGVAAVSCTGDVGTRAGADAMVSAAVKSFGAVDILVANAGIVRAAPFLEMTEEDFDEVLRVNLKGVFLTSQAAAKQMVVQNTASPGRGGCIVTLSSVNATMAIPSIAGYNASKGGVSNLTRCMALALAPHNIRVNAVAPGSIMTDVLASVATDAVARERILSRTPLGRIGEPEEVASVVAFLASSAASYMTGQARPAAFIWSKQQGSMCTRALTTFDDMFLGCFQIVYVDGGRMALNYTVPVPKAVDE